MASLFDRLVAEGPHWSVASELCLLFHWHFFLLRCVWKQWEHSPFWLAA